MAKKPDISLKEVAKKVGVHRDTILRWIDKGRVQVTKKTNNLGHYVFYQSDIKVLEDFRDQITEVDSEA